MNLRNMLLSRKFGGSSVEVDATLTKAGMAADAAAVGERIEGLSEEIVNLDRTAVKSVNGKTGAVTLSASDVGALPEDTVIPAPYTLPAATADTLGGVKVGEGLQMDGDVLGVKPEGNYELIETITLEEDGIKSIVRDVSLYGLMVLAKFSKASMITNVFMEISCVERAVTGSGFIRTEGEASVRFNAQKKGAYWDLYSQGYVTGWGSGAYYGQNSAADVLFVAKNPKITSFRLYAADGIGELTKGSVIEIWGVRA